MHKRILQKIYKTKSLTQASQIKTNYLQNSNLKFSLKKNFNTTIAVLENSLDQLAKML